ncbi:transporter substrate-binding domain-containing protein [Halobacteriovorax sp. JY17]|uniref:substrate-binding periplasmic protein n=1 Tax=Halobacteriovorax sp. JY17 TaxID=2014617 RepID=UPI000C62BEC2|nr:transporter substrate-binding domain-containing protein [Halobacteriovorax sp. JY17]PIK14745.1 MAG: hypothetical protein CES88_10425 [Halobacteriovorax sp. JY17]
MKGILILLTIFINLSISALEVNIGVENSWPPYADENGEGISSNIVIEAFKEVGVKVKLHIFPYTRIMEMTKRGELDGCYNVTRDKSTNTNFIFGKEPILRTTASYYQPVNTPYKKELIAGDKIALMRGYQYGDEFEKNKDSYIETRVNTQEQILKLLERNRVNVAILADGSANFHIKRLNLENVIKKGAVHFNLEVFLAFSKESKNSKKLAALLDKGISKLKKKGVYEDLLLGKKKGQKSLAQNP